MFARKLASLCLALALVYSISFPARADLLKNFKADGSIETRSFSINNETDRNSSKDDYRAETNFRLMLGGSFDLLDDVHSRILLGKEGRQTGTTGESLNSVQDEVKVDNAYVKIDKVFGHVDLTVGRQFYGNPNDLVIYFGPNNDDILSINSLDLFRADADIMGVAKFQGIAGKIVDDSVYPAAGVNGDTDIWGAEINSDKVIPAGNLAAYYYTTQIKKAANVLPGNNTLIVYGARAAGDIKLVGGLGYNAEYILNGGRNNGVAGTPGYNGSAYDLGLHYGRDVAAMPVRAKVDYAQGSHNFTGINAGRRYGIIWGEQTSLAADPSNLGGVDAPNVGISNLKVLDAGVGINPLAKLGVDFNAYRFRYSASTSDKTSVGTEYDLILSWKHSNNVSFEVNAATFQVGDALQNAAPTPTSPITRLGADMKITF